MASECKASFETVSNVDSCPDNESSWKDRANIKNCTIQTKCDNKKLEYHCLLTGYQNQSIEVCAPNTRLVNDYCPAYSIQGKRITDQFNCSMRFRQQCPKNQHYSNTIYKYPICLQRRVSVDPEKPNVDTGDTNSSPIIALAISIPLIVLLIVFFMVYRYRKRIKRTFNHGFTGDEEGVPLNDLKDLSILLIGKTGTGKSATGNTLLGKKVFEEDLSPSAVTDYCKKESATRFGKKICVIDTPGLFDPSSPDASYESMENDLRSVLSSGVDVILLVFTAKVPLSRNEDLETIENIEKFFGDAFYNHCILLFTGDDELRKVNFSFSRYCREVPKFMKECFQKSQHRKIIFDNTLKVDSKNHVKQVRDLFYMIESYYQAGNVFHLPPKRDCAECFSTVPCKNQAEGDKSTVRD